MFYEKTGNDYRQEICTSTNWLFDIIVNDYSWTITPIYPYSYAVLIFGGEGHLNSNGAGGRPEIRPTVYLTSDVKITGGDGTLENMYKLSL